MNQLCVNRPLLPVWNYTISPLPFYQIPSRTYTTVIVSVPPGWYINLGLRPSLPNHSGTTGVFMPAATLPARSSIQERANRETERNVSYHQPPPRQRLGPIDSGWIEFDTLFVDFNYLMATQHRAVIKELAVAGRTVDGAVFQQSYLVHSPMFIVAELTEQSTNDLLTELHGIEWTDGDVNIYILRHLVAMFNNARALYVPGEKKIGYFKGIFAFSGTVLDVQSLRRKYDLTENTTHTKSDTPLCAFHVHRPNRICALRNAHLMNKKFEAQQWLTGIWEMA